MAPSLSDLYQILRLPRISNVDIENRCVIGRSSSDNGFLHLAISASDISTYVLTPSPKLVWSYSLSPSIIVKQLTVLESNNKVYFAASLYNSDTKKHALKIVVNDSLLAPKASDDQSQSADQEVKVVDVEFSQEIKSISFSKNEKLIYLLMASGEISSYTFNINDAESSFIQPVSQCKVSNNNKSTMCYHKYISNIDGSGSNSAAVNNNDGFFLTVNQRQNKNLSSTIIMLHNGEMSELTNNSSISTGNAKNEEFAFTYNSGILYVIAIKAKTLDLYAIASGSLIKQLSLKPLFDLISTKQQITEFTRKNTGMVSPSDNRVLINLHHTIFLINTKFETVLSDYQLSADKPEDDIAGCLLLDIGEVKGTSSKSYATSLNLLMLHNNDKNYTFHNLAVDVGNNSLVESLGKGIEVYCEKSGVSPTQEKSKVDNLVVEYLITEKNLCQKKQEFGVKNKPESEKVQAFIDSLTGLSKSHKSMEFDLEFINFVKHKSYKLDKIKDIYSQISDLASSGEVFTDVRHENDAIYGFVLKETSANKDYRLSNKMFQIILDLIFSTTNKDGEFTYKLKNKKFVPKLGLIYLINSNLFPLSYSCNGLLKKFKSEPIILNTIISNYDLQISVEDILLLLCDISQDANTNVAALNSNKWLETDDVEDVEMEVDEKPESTVANKELELLFKKLIRMLLNTKAETQIVKTVKTLLNSSAKEHELFNENFEKLIYNIVNLNYGIKLLNLVIDGIGILNFKFNNDADKMTELIKYAGFKIREVMKFEPIEEVLDEIILACDAKLERSRHADLKSKMKNKKKNSKKVDNRPIVSTNNVTSNSVVDGPKIVSVKNNKVDEKLNAIVGFEGGFSQDEKYGDKIPPYSIERLINL
ncbi:hypothetical protein DASC09_040840 [Saccharomycopsis crataegensis]|uniref:Utp8 beta-propeller domain-containing protein n=1 Tax=Saccharomycopsis crataegensis TaxID=43959 RepID=A0AAV5QPV0_9ASCO|nr:hypothetical protein DASC09_040840 [Saccharomycopsis crataegensis]